MKKITVSSIAALIVFATSAPMAIADDAEPAPRAFEEFPDALGVFFGLASGMGLSYHSWLPDTPRSGIQVAAGVLYSPDAANDIFWGSVLDYTVGLEYQYSVFGEDFVSWLSGLLYLWGGIAHYGFIEQIVVQDAVYTDDYDLVSETVYGAGPYTPTITIGIGIGVEVILFRHFSFPIEVGYVATYNLIADTFLAGFNVTLTPQGGGRYRF